MMFNVQTSATTAYMMTAALSVTHSAMHLKAAQSVKDGVRCVQ